MAAAGGSYGGYMADWIATHTGRFKAIVSHASVYDKVSMLATEELWFEEHDMQGTPWTNPESYRKWAPVTYAGELGKFKTPTLVIAGSEITACRTRNRWNFSARCSARGCRRSWWFFRTRDTGC